MKKLLLIAAMLLIPVLVQAGIWDGVSMEVNKKMPVQVDQLTLMTSTTALDNGLVYYITIDAQKSEMNAKGWTAIKEELRKTTVNRAKTDPTLKIFRDLDATVIFKYFDNDGVFLFEFFVMKGK